MLCLRVDIYRILSNWFLILTWRWVYQAEPVKAILRFTLERHYQKHLPNILFIGKYNISHNRFCMLKKTKIKILTLKKNTFKWLIMSRWANVIKLHCDVTNFHTCLVQNWPAVYIRVITFWQALPICVVMYCQLQYLYNIAHWNQTLSCSKVITYR